MELGKIKGISIKLHFSTLLIIGLVGFYVASFYFTLIPEASIIELVTVGLINGVIILVSILIHEVLHSIFAQHYGIKVSEIELYIFGGVSKIEEEPKTPKQEIIIVAVGPLSSLLIGITFIILLYLPINYHPLLWVTWFYSGTANLLLGLFNLLPAFPMDGGRILRSILWKKRGELVSATKTAAKVGTFFGYGFIIYGFLQMLIFGLFAGLWLIFIGIFLNNAAREGYLETVNQVNLSKITLKNITTKKYISIPFNTLIREAILNYFTFYKMDYFPVVQGNDIVGLIHIDDVRDIPPENYAKSIIGYIMKPISHFPSISSEESGKKAFNRMKSMQIKPKILVVKQEADNHILGFIGQEDLRYALNVAEIQTNP